MGLLSFLHKNKQESKSEDREFLSRAEEDSNAIRSRGKRGGANGGGNGVREPVDPVLPEKKRARRRLIGAIALVLAVIVGLPMVLDSEPKPLAGDVAIQIPSRDKPVERTVASSARVAASDTLDPSEEMLDPAQAKPEARPEARPDSKPVKPAEKEGKTGSKPIATANSLALASPAPSLNTERAQAEPARPHVAEKPVPAPSEKNIEKPAEKPITKVRDEAPAVKPKTENTKAAAREDKPEHKMESKPEVKAEAKAETKPVQKPAPAARADKEEGDDAARATAILEGRAEHKAAESRASENKPGEGKPRQAIVLQVAALTSAEKISQLQGKLREAGIKSYSQKVAGESGDLTRIRVGPFADKEEADRVRAKLKAIGLSASLVQ